MSQITSRRKVSFQILIADPDPVYRTMITTAWNRNYHINGLDFVSNGDELELFLAKKDNYSKKSRPDLILMEFNLSKVNNLHCLEFIKSNPNYSDIPVIILSDSKKKEDISFCYSRGGCSFITKPQSIDELAVFLERLRSFWFEVSQVPSRPELLDAV